LRASFEQRNGRQPGDPAKLAKAMLWLADEPVPPLRFTAGAIAFESVSSKLAGMQAELQNWRELSLDTDYAA